MEKLLYLKLKSSLLFRIIFCFVFIFLIISLSLTAITGFLKFILFLIFIYIWHRNYQIYIRQPRESLIWRYPNQWFLGQNLHDDYDLLEGHLLSSFSTPSCIILNFIILATGLKKTLIIFYDQCLLIDFKKLNIILKTQSFDRA